MKMKTLEFRSEVRPNSDSDDLYIFDGIGEYKDFDGTWDGWGPERLREELETCPHDKLTVHINSNGGSTFQGVAIHNMLKASGKEITVSIEGVAASAASFIAMAGHKIQMGTASMLMIHNCWTFAYGNAKELRKIADDMDKIMVGQKEVMLKRSGGKITAERKIADDMDKIMVGQKEVMLKRSGGKITAEQIDQLMDEETYLTAEECMEYGWCDEIVDSGKPEDDDGAVSGLKVQIDGAAVAKAVTQAMVQTEEMAETSEDVTPDIEVKAKSFWDFF